MLTQIVAIEYCQNSDGSYQGWKLNSDFFLRKSSLGRLLARRSCWQDGSQFSLPFTRLCPVRIFHTICKCWNPQIWVFTKKCHHFVENWSTTATIKMRSTSLIVVSCSDNQSNKDLQAHIWQASTMATSWKASIFSTIAIWVWRRWMIFDDCAPGNVWKG